MKVSTFKAEKDTKILNDFILVEDINQLLKQSPEFNWRQANYSVNVHEVVKGNLCSGFGGGKELIIPN